jgi:nucleotidyltransferase substrate binding protein (TIGR01987 family)
VKLDLTALRNAIAALQKSVDFLRSNLARERDLRDQFRAASIQGFEFTYEVAHKMQKRQLEQISANPAEVDAMTYMQVIRAAAEAGLVSDVARWKEYRDKRNITSHTYNPERAEEIVEILEPFLRDVRLLLAELEHRNRAAD